MENALSPAEAVNVWPSILNSMLMAVCPMPLDGRGAAEGIQVLAEVDEGEGIVEVEEVEVGVVADVVAMVSGKAVYEVSAGDAVAVVAGPFQGTVGVATAVPATKARGGSKTKFGSASSHILQEDHSGTMSRTSVGIARIGFRSDQIVEHCEGGLYGASVPLIYVVDTSVLQRFIQL